MGIDGIGKSGKTAEIAAHTTTATTTATLPTFEVGKKTGVESTTSQSPLDQLRAGKIDLNQYLDLKVEQAVSGLDKLAPERLDFIRSSLRSQLQNDPGLSELVSAVTASTNSNEG